MNFHSYGKGQIPVVLIHGGPSLFGYMGGLGKRLSDNFRVIDYAQRGTFENPAANEDITLAQHIADLHEVVVQSGSEKVVLLGHSWGANLALLFAATYPELVLKIILIGLAPLNDSISDRFGENLQNRMSPSQKREVDRLEELFQNSEGWKIKNQLRQKRLDIMTPLYNFDPNSVRELPKARWNFETFKITIGALWEFIDAGKVCKMLKAISTPVIAFHGEHDPIPMRETFDFLAQQLPHCVCKAIPKAGHFPWVEPNEGELFLKDLKIAILS